MEECKFAYIVGDLLAGPLERKQRSKLFRGMLQALAEVAVPDAIHMMNSEVCVDPQAFLHNQMGPLGQQMLGSINVRFYNVNGRDEECLMNTLGMATFGLPDVQCHFRDLDPNLISNLLYNVALYLFEKGDVINDGETIQGVDGKDWVCQHEVALGDPERTVLDLNPGKPYALWREA